MRPIGLVAVALGLLAAAAWLLGAGGGRRAQCNMPAIFGDVTAAADEPPTSPEEERSPVSADAATGDGSARGAPDGRDENGAAAHPDALVLVGRLLDLDGRPVVHTECVVDDAPWLAYATTSGPGWPPGFTTDGEGWFDAALLRPGGWGERPRQEVAPGVSVEVPLEVRPRLDDGRPDPARRAALPLGRIEPGRVDVGDVRLETEPLFVAGRVVRPDGAPVADAEVRVSVVRPVRPGSLLETVGAPSDPRSTRVRTGADGAFVVHARLDDLEGSATATLDNVATDVVSFRRGAADVRLLLVPVGAVEGRVVLDPGTPGAYLRYAFHGERDGRSTTRRPAWPEADGTFRATGLREGTWSFVVTVPGEEPPVARVDGVVVPPDATASDPRLDPLDLRGRVVRHELEVVDASGAPVASAAVSREDVGRTVGHTDADGHLTILSVAPSVVVTVVVEGKARLGPQRVAGRSRLTLRAGR